MNSDNTTNDGGPAFPTNNGPDRFNVSGMTLRDYFAAKASDADVALILARVPDIEKVRTDGDRRTVIWGPPDNARQIARYMHADAMLKARQA